MERREKRALAFLLAASLLCLALVGLAAGDPPAERAEAKGMTSVAGKFRVSRDLSISRPTAPVAPTTATTSFFSDMVSSILEQKRESLGACDFRKAFDVHLTPCRRCQERWRAFSPKRVAFFGGTPGSPCGLGGNAVVYHTVTIRLSCGA